MVRVKVRVRDRVRVRVEGWLVMVRLKGEVKGSGSG